LFNVAVEAAPAPQVAPAAEPQELAEFAAAAAATAQQRVAAAAPAEAGHGARGAQGGLRAKGIGDESRALTYSGPAEDGSTQIQGNGDGAQDASAGTTRRERRQAARRQSRGAKHAKSAKRR
jgi:preprotein translocase subunit SecA